LVTFTYSGNYIHTITKLFKNTDINIAFKTTHTIGPTNKYDHTRIYKLTCAECHKSYKGQTGLSLNIRYKEHIRNIEYNREDSGFATHILRNTHQYGKINNIM
jgi:hypothetical protein